MRVIDLGNGQEEYDDEIYDRRGGRGRSRRSDGTYMGYDGGVYDHYGKDRDGMMEELERRERNLERRERELERNERELEKRQKHHEREDEMYRKGWFGEREIRDEYDSMDPYMRRGRRSRYYWGADADDPDYKRYIDTHGYHFSKELAREAADKMLNADGSKRRWTMEDAKQMFDKCGAKKPDNATWGDIQYLFAMFYSDYFPKVLDCDQKIVKAVLAYLEDPDVGDTIKWSEMIWFDTTLEEPCRR